ncbi:MAG: hypothetical protein ACREUQ_10050, partial [Burkholderiales bacterium]
MKRICYLAVAMVACTLARADNLKGYPTSLRVEFVLNCMRDREGTEYELMNKCSCALDSLARRFTVDQFVEALTTADAVTIAGERGAALRDNEQARKLARQFRAAVKDAEIGCFLRQPEES